MGFWEWVQKRSSDKCRANVPAHEALQKAVRQHLLTCPSRATYGGGRQDDPPCPDCGLSTWAVILALELRNLLAEGKALDHPWRDGAFKNAAENAATDAWMTWDISGCTTLAQLEALAVDAAPKYRIVSPKAARHAARAFWQLPDEKRKQCLYAGEHFLIEE